MVPPAGHRTIQHPFRRDRARWAGPGARTGDSGPAAKKPISESGSPSVGQSAASFRHPGTTLSRKPSVGTEGRLSVVPAAGGMWPGTPGKQRWFLETNLVPATGSRGRAGREGPGEPKPCPVSCGPGWGLHWLHRGSMLRICASCHLDPTHPGPLMGWDPNGWHHSVDLCSASVNPNNPLCSAQQDTWPKLNTQPSSPCPWTAPCGRQVRGTAPCGQQVRGTQLRYQASGRPGMR